MCICVYVHMNERVPVVWGRGPRPGELYCTSAQASHSAETPWEQSHGAESSLTSQRWRTQPEGQHKVSFTYITTHWTMWTDFLKRGNLKVCEAHADDSPLQPASRLATYWVQSVWEQTLVAKPPPPKKQKFISLKIKTKDKVINELQQQISINTWVNAYEEND